MTAYNYFFRLPALGNHYRDARNLAILLDNMVSGMDAYCIVFDALHSKYGSNFKTEFLREVAK